MTVTLAKGSMFHSELFDELASMTGLPVLGCCSFHELRGT